MSEKKERFTCFSCLMESVDPSKCTACGAKIEPIDIDDENIVFMPPRWGEYVIPSNLFSVEKALAAVAVMRTKYFNDLDTDVTQSDVRVASNDMAYEKLLELLAEGENLPVSKVKGAIKFIEKSRE